MGGSVLGGRWSDHVLRKLKAANGGRTISEVCVAFLHVYVWRVTFPALIGPFTKHDTDDVNTSNVISGICMDGREEGARIGVVHRALRYGVFFRVRCPIIR